MSLQAFRHKVFAVEIYSEYSQINESQLIQIPLCLQVFDGFSERLFVSQSVWVNLFSSTHPPSQNLCQTSAFGAMKRLEFGICGLDVTVSTKRLAELFQAPPGCALEPVAAFQLAYQGFPWNPAKGYEKLGSNPPFPQCVGVGTTK